MPEVEEARKVVRELFAEDYKSPAIEVQKSLPGKLLKQAAENRNDAVSHFALLIEAQQLAINVADADTALAVMESLIGEYAIDHVSIIGNGLVSLCKSTRATAGAPIVVRHTIAFASYLARGGQTNAVNDLFTAARACASSSNDPTLAAEVEQTAADLNSASSEQRASLSAEETLKTSPDDARANLISGKYRCFIQLDWNMGLPRLAKCNDNELRGVAMLEMTAPTNAQSQIEVGDGWWNVLQTCEGKYKPAIQQRCKYWYSKGISGLTGIKKSLIEKRLTQLAS